MKKLALFVLVLAVLLVPAVANAQFDSPLPPGEGPPPPSGEETLKAVLLWLVSGVGAGAVAYWLVAHIGWLANLDSEKKRYAGLGLSAAVACLGFVAAVGLEYEAQPAGWKGWLEQLFAIAYLAVTVSQVIHGRLRLRVRGS